jgi:mannitol/fructose-specific phosphotransferase system IIA component (Ntr-type)
VGAHLMGIVQQYDMVVLLSTREHTLAWRPVLNQLPRLVADRFPATNLVVIYPSELGIERSSGRPAARTRTLRLLHAPRQIVLDVSPGEPRILLAQILAPVLAEQPGALQAALIRLIETTEVPELAPGVALFHTHAPEVQAPALAVGLSREGLALPGIASPVAVVLILLSPADLPPQEHLRNLAAIARVARTPDLVTRLADADSPDEAFEMLQDAAAQSGI